MSILDLKTDLQVSGSTRTVLKIELVILFSEYYDQP